MPPARSEEQMLLLTQCIQAQIFLALQISRYYFLWKKNKIKKQNFVSFLRKQQMYSLQLLTLAVNRDEEMFVFNFFSLKHFNSVRK